MTPIPSGTQPRPEAVREAKPVPTMAETVQYFLRLLHLIRRYWGQLGKSIALGLVIGLFGMLGPYTSKLLIDNVYPARDVGLMEVLVIAVFVMSVSSSLMGAVQSYYSQVVSARLGSATSLMFFNHLQYLHATFFDTHQVGEVLSRFQDVRTALGIVSNVIQVVLTNGVYIVIVPPFLLLLNWKLAILAVVVTPLTIAISTVSSRIVRRYYKLNAEANAELNAYQFEVFSHFLPLKAMAIEPEIYQRVEQQMHRVLHTQLRAGRMEKGVGLVNGLIRAGGAGVFTWYAWTLILRQELTLGAFIAFTAYLGYLTGPLTQFASLFTTAQQAAISLGRMFEYLDTPVEQDPTQAYDPAPPLIHRIHRGEVTLSGVSFHYDPAQPILYDVDLIARSGEVTAIIGPSGAGKSTLLRLIPRLINPTRGTVCVDGVPTDEISINDLRRQVAVVWQGFGLMRGSVWDNLTMGFSNVSRRSVEDAVQICRLDDMIANLAQGYDTPLAEWGATLSGGQRQRMAIARALIRDTPILVLDEATANIDINTEEGLLADLFSRCRDKTVIFVTHRVTVSSRVDHVCLLSGGRVEAAGAPSHLAETNKIYRQFLGGANFGDEMRRLHIVPTV